MKANKLLIVVLLLGSFFLVSCLPAVINYYRPEAEGGTVTKRMCGGQAGPEEKIEFSNDGVRVYIWSNRMRDGISFPIFITIPKGSEVQIRTSSVKFFVPSTENAFEGFLNPRAWRIGDLLIGELVEENVIRTHDKLFTMTTKVDISKPEKIKLILPTFYINNKQWNLPEISFSKERWWGILPLNC
jgi:hypothetical protein